MEIKRIKIWYEDEKYICINCYFNDLYVVITIRKVERNFTINFIEKNGRTYFNDKRYNKMYSKVYTYFKERFKQTYRFDGVYNLELL